MSRKWTAADMPSLAGKLAVVTGANSGLGYDTALELARRGAEVVLACRSRDKTEAAMREMRAAAPGAKLEFMALDLADLASVRGFADAFKARRKRLDLLCNNAGVMALPLTRTRDGFEMQIGTNHLGHFALTGLLLDRLQSTPGARIVNVASMAHRWTRGLDLDDLNFERRRYNKWDAYGKSKLANLVFTFELDRRLKKAGGKVLAVAAHPGYSATNLGFAGPAMEKSVLGKLFIEVGNALLAQPAAMGALPTLYAATADDMQCGDYVGPDGWRQMRGHPKKVGCRSLARDPELGTRLWGLSQTLTGVRYL
ncbi:MAG: SDR family NAD(P)-dependent oxidoreductase [Gammaproteobacteria bacterium]|nr:SDR family NAD(P)-dependent oxidoreductase [Gammaproteobacteria bacterium]